jgi:hypothetical protein
MKTQPGFRSVRQAPKKGIVKRNLKKKAAGTVSAGRANLSAKDAIYLWPPPWEPPPP